MPSFSSLKQIIYRQFTKGHGLSLKTDALRYLEEALLMQGVPEGSWNDAVEFLVEAYVKKEDVDSSVLVTKEALENLVETLRNNLAATSLVRPPDSLGLDSLSQGTDYRDTCMEDSPVDAAELFWVINAFDMPRWNYLSDLKTFEPETQPATIFAAPTEKGDMYRARFNLLKQRTLRNEHFSAPAFVSNDRNAYFKITPIKSLLGRENEQFLLFGMLTELQDGKFFLEDEDANIELDLSSCRHGSGFFVDNCFILAEGTYTEDNIFKVDELGLPPAEKRSVTDSTLGTLDFLGLPKILYSESILLQEEKLNEDIAIITISDVWLDQPKILKALRKIFEGYSESLVPLAFILIGNFISTPYPYSGAQSQKYKECFSQVADLIAEFPNLANFSHFVFVPGSNDPWGSNVLPRPPIPNVFTTKIRQKVKRAHFTSNPCRIKYCTQEIVIFREDILSKLRRNCLLPPNIEGEDDDLTKHLIRTVLDEAHLCPLTLSVRPIYWAYDHALRLYPMPRVLVLADQCENYGINYQDCHCINPGSFPNSDFTFSLYYPATGKSEKCVLPTDTLW